MASALVVERGDEVSIAILEHDEGNAPCMVDESGDIHHPLAGDVRAAGLTLQALRETLKVRLAPFYKDPVLLISIENYAGATISVLGAVRAPGNFPYSKGMTLGQARGMAGGAIDNANLHDVVLLSSERGVPLRKMTNYLRGTEGYEPDPLITAGTTG